MKKAEINHKIYGIEPPKCYYGTQKKISTDLTGTIEQLDLKILKNEAKYHRHHHDQNSDSDEEDEGTGGAGRRRSNNVPWYDRYIIERTSLKWVLWNLINTIVSIISAFLYAYMCAFGLKEGTFLYQVDSIFEIIFISDSLVQFIVEYEDEKTRKPVKNL